MVSEAGFLRTAPTKEVKAKLELYREYTDGAGKPIDKVALGDEVQVHVRLRSLADGPIANVAIVDLLPGGFEVVLQEPVKTSDREPAHAEGGEGEGEGVGEGEGGEGDGYEPEEGSGGGGTFALPIAVTGS